MELADLSALTLLFTLLMYIWLDGADLGVGMLFFWFRDEQQKQRMVHSILPVWDANETWLVLLAGGMLALFPAAYSKLFSVLYLPVFVMLLCLFIRALALEYRVQAGGSLRRWLDKLLPFTSACAAFCQGWCAGIVLEGQSLLGFSLYALLCGLGLMVIYLLLGCCWIRWRIGEPVELLANALTWFFWVVAIVLFLALVLLNPDPWRQVWSGAGKSVCLLIAALWLMLLFSLYRFGPRVQLGVTLLLIAAVLAGVAWGIYPWLIPGSLICMKARPVPLRRDLC
ncbi:cytochrome d ubiquinol oxidase subunit II [Pantoea sp. LMR881]|uniref:cytochrome d ubiquinol oxidase subunit II n=1 Tax=Pantoea sp. LMR881 TaxID=3014336 RepID=UPI0022AF9F08|nr:cytochrome d ubiquinol oxidase subunit II [Pantoea sp. LMR881]MCZ4058003.1 cytochrome d ubiquinol oxidase subunit II [Pantoea sp. LMR881]